MKYDIERINRRRRRRGVEPLPAHRPRPGRPSLQLNKRELIQLYVKDGLSLRDIGKRFKVSKDTIQERLKAYGIERRDKRKYLKKGRVG